MPNYHKTGAKNNCTYVLFGEVIENNNPYFGTQEKRCQNKICRVLCPEKVIDKASVIRDDGTSWTVYLSNFKEVHKIEVIDKY
ncbi:MAG: hypothetical protein ACRDD7_08465 [Peptostreptococcaceae bacterium]